MKTITNLFLTGVLLLCIYACIHESPKMPSPTDRELFLQYLFDSVGAYTPHEIEKSVENARKFANLAKEKNDIYWAAEFYFMGGDAFYSVSRFDSALWYYSKTHELQKQAIAEGTEDKNQNDYLTIYRLTRIGEIHNSRGNSNAALEYYFQALPVAEQINDLDEVAHLYYLLAGTYYQMSNHEQAEAYLLKSNRLYSELNNPLKIANNNINLSAIWIARNDLTKAMEYGEEAWQILRSLPKTPDRELANAAMRLSEIWMRIPDYDKAMEFAQMTMEYAYKSGFHNNIVSALYTLSTVYLKQEKYAECEQTAFEALAVDSTSIYLNSILFANIAQANIWIGNADKSIEYFGKTLNSHRAYSSQNFQASLSEMEVRYETEKKEMRITTLEEERKLMLWLSIAGGAILLLVVAMFLFLWRLSVQKKRLAEQQVKQLEQEKQLVATQSILAGETAERTRLARDLHDGLGSMLTGVKLNLETVKNGSAPEKTEIENFDNALKLLNESMLELRRVAHHLMPDSLSRYGLKTALTDFCNNFPSVEFDYFGSEERLGSKMEVVVYRIVHELVNNALKHAGASQIMVQVIRESDYVALIVRDDGAGFDISAQTGGIGLQNIRNRVASYNGRMEIFSKPGEGTEVNIELRVNDSTIQ